MSREPRFPFRMPKSSCDLRSKVLLPSTTLRTAHCPWKDFEENQKALKKNTSLKQGEVTVNDWLEQCKIKIAPEDKVTEKARWEPDKTRALSQKRAWVEMSPFHSRHWLQALAKSHRLRKEKKSSFPAIKPTAMLWSLPSTLTDWNGNSVGRTGPAGREEQQWEKPAASSPFSMPRARATSRKEAKPLWPSSVDTPPIASPPEAVSRLPHLLVPWT